MAGTEAEVEASPLTALQPDDEPSAEPELSAWSQTRSQKRKQKNRKRNKQSHLKDAPQGYLSVPNDFDDLSDIAATDDEQSTEEPAQHQETDAHTFSHAVVAAVAPQTAPSAQHAAGKARSSASRFGGEKKPWHQTQTHVLAGGGNALSEGCKQVNSPRIKAVQPDPQFLALVSISASQ